MIVHQRKLDRRGGATRGATVVASHAGSKAPGRGSRAAGGLPRRRQPEHRAEAPRIAVSQRDARVENDVDVIVRLARRGIRECAEAARHAEMHEQRVRGRAKEQVLAARSSASIVRPAMRFGSNEGTDQRNRRSYTCMAATRRPTTIGARP
jgi:hypothetical protein